MSRSGATGTSTKFKKLISVLVQNRIGHARFRRGPVSNQPDKIQQHMTPLHQTYATIDFVACASHANSFISSSTGDTNSSGFQITNLPSLKTVDTDCANLSGRCHSSKKRYRSFKFIDIMKRFLLDLN